MAGLTLTLKPREKFLVGGHLVENGPRRSSIRVLDDSVFVLRLSDALHPDEVTTPVRRVYHICQQILACEIAADEGLPDLFAQLDKLLEIFAKTPHRETVQRTCAMALQGRYHGVLVGLKALMEIEETLLHRAEISSQDAPCAVMGRR